MELKLSGRKIIVVGASAGIGRSLAIQAARAGADVLLCGRRAAALEETRSAAGGGQICAVDLTTDDGAQRLAEKAAAFGTVDAVVSTVGSAPLIPIEQMKLSHWVDVLQANVAGFNAAVAALLPHLADGAVVLALSSEAVSMPRWGLAAYTASKAALENSLAGWRTEHSRFRFGIVGVGSTVPTEFARDFEPGLLGTALDIWAKSGLAQASFMDVDEVGRTLAGYLDILLDCPGVGAEHLLLRSPSAVVDNADAMRVTAFGEE